MADAAQSNLLQASRGAGAGEPGCARVGHAAREAPHLRRERSAFARRGDAACRNLSRKLAASAGRRNSAGVFGPSQAGKSYLVSALARNPEPHPLTADFAGTKKDFLAEINPPGDRESTGLVTRFTVVPGTTDTTHPVELRLLTETDLVKILGNSFLSDFDPNNRTVKLPDETRSARPWPPRKPKRARQPRRISTRS